MAGYMEVNSQGEYILDFSPLISGEKKSLPFEIEITFPPFEKDILSCFGKFIGSADDKNEEFTVSFKTDVKLKVLCSRCAEEMDYFVKQEFSSPLCGKKPERDTEEYECFKKGKINLTELVREFVILSLPTQLLCKKNCAGLCHTCGANLNLGECKCETAEIDSRLQPLADFLKKLNEETEK
jgi:uncharacterized protein